MVLAYYTAVGLGNVAFLCAHGREVLPIGEVLTDVSAKRERNPPNPCYEGVESTQGVEGGER